MSDIIKVECATCAKGMAGQCHTDLWEICLQNSIWPDHGYERLGAYSYYLWELREELKQHIKFNLEPQSVPSMIELLEE